MYGHTLPEMIKGRWPYPGRLGDYMNFDFNICWQSIEAVKQTMDRFVSYLKDELLVKHDLSKSNDRKTGCKPFP